MRLLSIAFICLSSLTAFAQVTDSLPAHASANDDTVSIIGVGDIMMGTNSEILKALCLIVAAHPKSATIPKCVTLSELRFVM
jgi:spore coat polysaccharide biosynthesis protein SpsF (cytidylyltransferase family)